MNRRDLQPPWEWLVPNHLLSVKDAAAYLSLSERKLRSLLPSIPKFRIDGKVLLRVSDLDRWVERYREAPQREQDLNKIAEEAVRSLRGS